MLRAERLEATLLQAKQFRSRIFAGTHRLVPLCLGSPQSPELGFSKLSKLYIDTGNHSSTGQHPARGKQWNVHCVSLEPPAMACSAPC